MKTTIIGRQMNVYDDTKSMIERKLEKLDKYFREDMSPEATVTLSRKRSVSTLEVTVNAGGTMFRSEVDSDDFRSAMDKTIDNIERQIRKNKTRLAKRLRETIPEDPMLAEESEDPGLIIRVKQFEFCPMTPEDAIMQMNLLGHNFFVFNDLRSGDTCVVYTRKDGSYGLIEPMK